MCVLCFVSCCCFFRQWLVVSCLMFCLLCVDVFGCCLLLCVACWCCFVVVCCLLCAVRCVFHVACCVVFVIVCCVPFGVQVSMLFID